jgi:alkylation response protein AidB-like acyl-CoA dehydrogenase
MTTSGDPSLSEGQKLLRDEVRRFCEERIRPGVAERDRSHTFPRDILAELGEMGLLGMTVDEEYGGSGLSGLELVIVIEEIARVCPSVAVSLSVSNSVCCWPINKFGRDGLKERVLPVLASGASLGGFALTEPGSGSDAGAMQTAAVRDADEWILNGEKAWITNAGAAEFYVALARTDPQAGHRGISAFVVPADCPGLSIGSPEEKLGLRASLTAPVLFEDCRIPAGHLLGDEGQGFKIALATLDHSRLGIAAQAVGIHQRALELAVDYAQQRVQFGRPIAEFQAVRFTIADMATRLEAARSLCRAAAAGESSPDAGRLAAEAKLFAAEAANRACWDSLQIHGGNGFSEEYEIARLYRDVRVTTIYEGTSEMQRRVIARHLLQ